MEPGEAHDEHVQGVHENEHEEDVLMGVAADESLRGGGVFAVRTADPPVRPMFMLRAGVILHGSVCGIETAKGSFPPFVDIASSSIG